MYRKVAIFGASGYISKYLIQEYLDKSDEIFLISDRSENIAEKYKRNQNIHVLKGSIGEEEIGKRLISENVDCFVNLYAQTDILFAERNANLDFQINVLSVVNFLSLLIQNRHQCNFFQIGTVTQFGLTPPSPIDESYESNPETIFDLHKNLIEEYLKAIDGKYGFRGISIRLSNVYGGESAQFSGNRGVVNRVIELAKAKNRISVYGDGHYYRNYIHVLDVAKCIQKLTSLSDFPSNTMVMLIGIAKLQRRFNTNSNCISNRITGCISYS